MIPADLTAEFGRTMRAAAAAGEIPDVAATVSAQGTWRSPPEAARLGPGSYATSLPLAAAARAGSGAHAIAEMLAGHVRGVPWIRAVIVTGPGYLTIAVTTEYLARVAERTAAAGLEAVRSNALAGIRLTAPDLPDLASAPDWPSAWRAHRDALLGRIAGAAGASVAPIDSEVLAVPPTASAVAASPVASAAAYYGVDAVRYVLARTASPDRAAIEGALSLRRDLTNPFTSVRYAHVDAASVARWAVDLGLVAPGGPSTGRAIRFAELQPRELALLDAMSWLGERTAAAARRRRPAAMAAYLSGLAAAWLACAEDCPALPFRGRAAPTDPGFRLLLAAGTRAALAAGLRLLGVTAPDRV